MIVSAEERPVGSLVMACVVSQIEPFVRTHGPAWLRLSDGRSFESVIDPEEATAISVDRWEQAYTDEVRLRQINALSGALDRATSTSLRQSVLGVTSPEENR